MLECPKCNAHVDGLRCGSCGYTEQGAKGLPPIDALRWNCADELNGQRCAELGRFTESVQGTDRWYCDAHYAPFRRMRAGGARAAPTSAFNAQRAKMRPAGELGELELERIAIANEERPL